MSLRFSCLIVLMAVITIPLSSFAVEQSAIAPGDTLRITVLGEPNYSKDAVVVDDDGNVNLPLAKTVQVAGMTPSQAATAIAKQLGKFVKNPDVTVEIAQKARKQVTVSGQVRAPGVYPLERETRLMEVVGLAGGFTETADTAKIAITRRDTAEPVLCDVKAFLAGSNQNGNPVLESGDVIVVPDRVPTVGTVFVYGSVRQPGQPIPIRDSMRVSAAVSAAGGIVPEQADTARATIKREGQDEPLQIDLAKALAGDPAADIMLQSGDTITVPSIEVTGTFTILGAVTNSGEYPVKDKMSIAKAVAAAGGPIPRAKLGDVRITRQDNTGKTQSLEVDLNRISEGKAADVMVQAGDTIYVPEGSVRDRGRLLSIGVAILGILIGR